MNALDDRDCDEDAPTEPYAVDVRIGDGHRVGEERDLAPIITPDELVGLLRLNRKTIYDLLARRQIPGVRRLGRRYRISRDAVLDWLRGQDRVSRARSKT
jgi:excisionase family DNA binding protein